VRHKIIAIALALGGCASSTTAEPVPSGVYAASCTVEGVRRERGDPDEAISYSGEGDVTIEDGAFLFVGDCRAPLVGYDGERFDVSPTDCPIMDGTVAWTTLEIRDGYGRVTADGELEISISVFWDRVRSGWTEEYTYACTGVRR